MKKKTQSTTDDLGQTLFATAHRTTKIELEDKVRLEAIGFHGDDRTVFLEILILRLYAMTSGVQFSSLSLDQKRAIINKMHNSFFQWLSQQLGYTQSQLDSVRAILVQRYDAYDSAQKSLIADRPIEASDILFNTLREVLSPELSTKNIFTTLPLFSEFFEVILALGEEVKKIVSETEIVAT